MDAGADPKEQMMANQVRRGLMTGRVTNDSPPQKMDTLSVNGGKHRKKHSVSVAAMEREKEKEREKDREETKEVEGEDDGGEEGEGGRRERRKKKEKLIKTLELADLQHLSAANLEALWKNYDKDKNGTLDRKELKKLAKDCIERTIAMCEEEIRRQQPKLTEAELKAAVEKELKFVLPGADKESGKKEDVQKEMVRLLVKKLDVNGDGDVTKAEAAAMWNAFAKELFKVRTPEAESSLACAIM